LPENTQGELHGKKLMDAATQRFLSRLENAPRLGQIKGDLSREDIYEEMADEDFLREGGYKGDISEAFLSVAEKDWKDWANPEEDIYDEYKACT